MHFTKIRVAEKYVELEWTEIQPNGAVIDHHFKNKETPEAELPAALAAFRPYVARLLDLDGDGWPDDVKIRALSLNTERASGARGVIVTAMKPIERAQGRPLVLNTPYLAEPTTEAEREARSIGGGYLDAETLAAITRAEDAATHYYEGARTQGELFVRAVREPDEPLADPTPNAEPPERPDYHAHHHTPQPMRNGSPKGAAKKAKGKGKKRPASDYNRDGWPVINVDANRELTDLGLRDLLLLVERDVPIDAVARWTATERTQAMQYADKVLTARSRGQDVKKVREPKHLQRDATPPLADGFHVPAMVAPRGD